MGKITPLTSEEKTKIKEWTGTLSQEEIARRLGRHPNTIYYEQRRLGLTRKPVSAKQIEQMHKLIDSRKYHATQIAKMVPAPYRMVLSAARERFGPVKFIGNARIPFESYFPQRHFDPKSASKTDYSRLVLEYMKRFDVRFPQNAEDDVEPAGRIIFAVKDCFDGQPARVRGYVAASLMNACEELRLARNWPVN
jgi:DNA-binding CsgD family transcriptional regulator